MDTTATAAANNVANLWSGWEDKATFGESAVSPFFFPLLSSPVFLLFPMGYERNLKTATALSLKIRGRASKITAFEV